jgi:formate dehydrogenase
MKHPLIPITPITPITTVDALASAQVHGLLEGESRRADLLIEHLHKIQDEYGCLSVAHLGALASEMGLRFGEVYDVATFYHHFDVVADNEPPPAALTVRVCDGLSCEMAGSARLLADLPARLGRGVRVIATPCVGRCEHAPAVMVGHNPLAPACLDTVVQAVARGASAHPAIDYRDYVDYAAYRAAGGYALLQSCMAGTFDAAAIIAMIESSGLRGLGGAGTPAGRKWRAVRTQPGPRLMVVNIDEGEPGTFKDRVLMERDPHRFLEGMLIAAWAVGIEDIYVYLRDEYHGCREVLIEELAALRQELPIAGLPQIHLRRGAGAYVCGEESALIESIEGKRGLPRARTLSVAQRGLFGRPTLEHNVETLYWVRELLERGDDWFASQGRHGRHGLRSYSVSGRVREPGVKLAPAGITIQELIDEHCGGMLPGQRLYAYLPGGASGGILPASLNQLPLDFDTLQPYGCLIGSAAVVVLSDRDTAVGAARNALRFFEHESCGQCTACGDGTARARALIGRAHWDIPLLTELGQTIRAGSICGLGQAAPNSIDCVIRYFAHELR